MSEWVLVPREPTKEMREAAYDSMAIASNGHFACRDSWARAYPAMLAAAPKPPEQEIELPPLPDHWLQTSGMPMYSIRVLEEFAKEAVKFDREKRNG